ncbi:ParB/RepB/Spo0J family partition protein [Streptomyces cinereoruber]|uniref:ParB/RepB/Spo0J family partition protein n=1 Tax=Streptomyces cinereoruber TaxID=67260 RepID=UPI00363ACB09
MAGQRVALSSLAGGKVETVPGIARPALVHVAPSDVAPTPLNPRIDFDKETLVELGTSMQSGQLAPCIAIPRAKYLELFPEHAGELPSCKYVMAAGERRWRAALEVGLTTLDLHIRQDIAETPAKFLAAVLAENIERKNFNYIEEAFGLQRMLEMSGGSQAEAAKRLSKSKQWFSQRIGILRLSPEMQQAVRDGELTAFREMRKYAALPADQQMTAWQADLKKAQQPAEEPAVALAETPPPLSKGDQSGEAAPATPRGYTAVYPSADPVPSPAVAESRPEPSSRPSEGVPSPALAQVVRHYDVVEPAAAPTVTTVVPDPRPAAPVPQPVATPQTEAPAPAGPVQPMSPTWDGAQLMDAAIERMDELQLSRLVVRYLAHTGNPEKLATHLSLSTPYEHQVQIARLLADAADLLRKPPAQT